jgi:hypothetical protein
MLKPSSTPSQRVAAALPDTTPPTGFAGATSEAFATINIGTMAEYEIYRAKLAAHHRHQDNVRRIEASGNPLHISRHHSASRAGSEHKMTRPNPTAPPSIPGYDYGTSKSAMSPVSESDLSQLEQAAGWTADDARVLAQHADFFCGEGRMVLKHRRLSRFDTFSASFPWFFPSAGSSHISFRTKPNSSDWKTPGPGPCLCMSRYGRALT